MIWLSRNISLITLMTSCAHERPRPNADAFSSHVTFFSHEGYQFAGQVRRGRLFVNVPCCQTYVADDVFKKLMLEGVEVRMGCTLASPVFTDGWVGRWQMTSRFSCALPEDTKA